MSDLDEKNPSPVRGDSGDEVYEDERELKRGVLDEFSRPAGIPLNRSDVNPRLRSVRGDEYGVPPYGAPPPPPPPPPNFYGYPPPPPPMGAFGYPPPPPPPRMPLPENMGIEYDENGNPVLVEYEFEEETVEETAEENPPNNIPAPEIPVEKPAVVRESLKGRSISLNDASLLSKQREGAEKATELEHHEKKEQRRVFFVRLFFFLIFMSAITAGAYFIIDIIKPQQEILPDNLGPNRNLAGKNYWNLEPSKANNVVMRFYEALGGVNKCGAVYDKMIWGSFHIGIRIEQFYCIEKRGIAYVKVGVSPNESIFLLNAEGKAKRLLTPSVSGDSEVMGGAETEALNGLIFFDEPLHKAAFVDYMSNRHPFKDLGHMTYNGEVFDAIEFQTLSGAKINYYFDLKTGLAAYKFVEQKDASSRVEYQDYVEFGGIKLPRVRNVFVNGKSYGTAVFDTIKFNRDIIFPR